MKNNELKFLANLAKQRLMNKNYTEPRENMRKTASSYFIRNAMALKKLKAETNYVVINNEEDIEFVNKVKELINLDCYNPLGILADQKYMSTLSDYEKQFYILNLSEKYTKVRNELLCG